MQMIADPNSSYELTFLQDSKQMGRVAVETMVKFLDAGGKIPQPAGSKIVEPVVLIPSILITKENVAQYIK
jgi:ABC-type sugar transport system substrate-binding protein